MGRGKRQAAFDKDWTKGSIVHNLLSLSWPIVISNSLNMLGPTIDMIWVGKLGAASIAGVGISGMAVTLMYSMRLGLSVGTRAMIARFMGAGDTEGANHVSQQALIVGISFGIFIAIIGIFLTEPILLVMGVESDVITEGAAYMRIMFVGSVAMSLWTLTESIMQASGDTLTPMRIAVFFRLLHAIICPFLTFGWWVFPRLGVSGAALTNIISQTVGLTLGLLFLFSGRTRLRLTLRSLRLDLIIIWRIVRIGIPAAITGFERSFANLVLVRLVVPFGTMSVAAHSLLQRVNDIIYMPGRGLGMAGGVLVGQNLGAGQPARSERTGWLTSGLLTSIMLICSMAIWLRAESIVHIFSTEPDVVKITSTFMRIEIASYLVYGFAIVLTECLNGAGDTMTPMLVTLLTMWGMQIPLAFFLPRITTLGVYGVRWAIVSGMIVRSVIYITYFRLGRWKRQKI
ncbi:MATE family efflux transporter [Chloroflexota bacterium]